MIFHVGQKVVCIDACGTLRPLQLNYIYEISAVDEHIVSVSAFDGFFWCTRFRPIVDRKTDISIFTRMLSPSKQDVEA